MALNKGRQRWVLAGFTSNLVEDDLPTMLCAWALKQQVLGILHLGAARTPNGMTRLPLAQLRGRLYLPCAEPTDHLPVLQA